MANKKTSRSRPRPGKSASGNARRELAARRRQRERLDCTFAALADPTRRAILAQLAEEDGLPAGRLAEPFRVSWPTVSRHLRVLENAGLLRQEKVGRVRRCHLEPEPLREAMAWVRFYEKFWSGKLDSLADFLEGRA